MIKKTRKIIVALFLFFSVFGGLMLSSPINAADQACTGVDTELENKQIKCNILDSASLKFYDSGDIEIPTDPDNPIVPTGSTFKANVSFSLNDNLRQIMANAEDSNGFYYEFDMEPSTIDVGSLNNLPLIMIGGGENGEDITFAHVSITDGKVRITFTAAIADLDSISGNFTINGDLILDESSTSNEIDIKIPAQQELNVTVKIQDAIEDVISKTGSIITNSDNLPTGIEWTIDINENSETLSNVKVTDTIPAGLTFTEVKVYDDSDDQLDASAYNVNVSSATPPVVTIDFLGDANHQINAPYKIVIKTSIDDYDDIQKESMNLTNTATLYSDETDNEEVYADVNVPFGKTIGKEASKFDRANGIISWESFFNGRGVTMPAGTVITDTYDSNLDFVTSSFTMTDEYDVAFTDYVLTQDASNHKFTITFPNGLDKKVILNYDTKIKAGLVIAGDGQEFTNDFTFGTTTVTGKHWVGQGNGVKKQTGIDYEKREIDYSIEVNKDKYQMKNLIITDSFDFKGLELIDGKDPVVTYKENDLDPETDYTFVKTDNNGGFKITLLGNYADPGIDDVLTINFTAKYDPEAIDDGGNTPNIPNSNPVKQYPANSVLRNTATVDFKVGDADYQSKSTVDTPLDSTITNNGLKTGSYDQVKKEITWGVYANYNGYTLDNATIIDELEGDQNLILDSVKLFEFSVAADGTITKGAEVDSADFEDNSQIVPNGPDIVSITLPDGNGRYYLEFKTSLAGEIIAETYTNTAKYTNGGHEESLTAKVDIPNGGKLVTKDGAQRTGNDGGSIFWKININSSRSTVEDVVISDEQSNNVIINQESFKLYKYIYDEDQGKFVIDEDNPLEINKDYTLTFSESDTGKTKFELKFIGDYTTIKDEFRLEYDSTINAEKGDTTVTNAVKFTGTNNEKAIEQETTKSVKFNADLAGEAVGSKRSITIHKLDSSSTENNKIYLEGADLKLVNSKSKTVRSGTTDEDGKIIFKGLVSGNYTLFEVTPPKGYHASTALSGGLPILITVDDQDLKVHEVYNDQNNVIITKLNASEEKLSGAQFKLEYYDESEEAWLAHSNEVYTTDDGKFEIPQLDEGKYRLIETSAPEGYILELAPFEFTINEEKGFIQEHDLINYQGSVQLTKNGILEGGIETTPLDGVIFELYKVGAEDQLIDTYTTDEGIIEVDGLAPGDYYFIEKSSSEGFIADKNPIHFTIASQNVGEPDLIELEAKNYKANVSFTKVDSFNNPIDGAEFELQKLNTQSDEYEKVDTFTSVNGLVQVSDLASGDYQFIETETIEGFILNTEPIKFTINDSITNQDELTIVLDDFVNYQGSIAIEKTDKDTNKLLNGAVFSLYTKDGKLVEKNITTMHGKILVEKLAPGKYYLVETKAPSGYIKSDQKYNFEITTEFAGQPDLEIIKITNKEDVLPTTGVDYSLIALVLVTISSLVGIRYYYREN